MRDFIDMFERLVSRKGDEDSTDQMPTETSDRDAFPLKGVDPEGFEDIEILSGQARHYVRHWIKRDMGSEVPVRVVELSDGGRRVFAPTYRGQVIWNRLYVFDVEEVDDKYDQWTLARRHAEGHAVVYDE